MRISNKPLVGIILLNYNSGNDTIECINSIKEITYSNYKIIVVDNKSTDNSIEDIKAKYKDVDIIENSTNGGFAYGNNIGIKYALDHDVDYVLLLNNDTVVEKNFLEEMVDISIKEEIYVLGCRINYFYDKSKIWYSGGKINWNKFYGEHIQDEKATEDIIEVDFITGCCMLLRKEVVQQFLLPEEYFMYFEDVDYCIQLKDNGYKLMVAQNPLIYHKVSASSGGEESPFFIRYWNRNRIILMNKYKNKVSALKYSYVIISFYFTRIIKYIIYLSSFKSKERKALVLGIKEGIMKKNNKGEFR